MQGEAERRALPDKPYPHRGSVTTRNIEPISVLPVPASARRLRDSGTLQ